ncbi:MyTH4 domain-containing protein, partial [Ochromonadaceae sp. CCMP2298]
VFMRTEQNGKLELAREMALIHVATVVQKNSRRMVARRRYKSWKKILLDVEAAIQSREEAPLAKIIDLAFELPSGGGHLDVIKRAKLLLARLREEKRVSQLLRNAIESRNVDSLKSAIAVHASVTPPFDTPLSAQAAALLARLEAELAMKGSLVAAIASRDKGTLDSCVAACQDMSFDCEELHQAQALVSRLAQEHLLIASLEAACQSEDLDEINRILATCMEQGMNTYYSSDIASANTVKQSLLDKIAAEEEERKRREEEEERQKAALAAIEAKRTGQVSVMKAKLVAMIDSKDAASIKTVLQEAIQAGFNFPEVELARSTLEVLQRTKDVKSQLQAAIDVLQVKAETGLNEADLQPLLLAIEMGTQLGEGFDELDEGVEMLEAFKKHAQAKAGIEEAYASKELDATHGKLAVSSGPSLQSAGQPYDEAEEKRQMRQEIAKQARFDVKNYPNLRSADDFARGAVLNKSKIKESFLTFQAMVIPKSLTDLSRENNKLALQIHKDLLGYMGDKQLPFPAMLAQDILRKGYEYKPIRDEIYMQIIKQLSNNARPESVAKGWQVMCMCVGTFPPSPEFENFLLHYIIEKRDRGRGAVIDYARYCLRTLEAMLNSGEGTGFVPSVEEILAYKERPPILATIYLV